MVRRNREEIGMFLFEEGEKFEVLDKIFTLVLTINVTRIFLLYIFLSYGKLFYRFFATQHCLRSLAAQKSEFSDKCEACSTIPKREVLFGT